VHHVVAGLQRERVDGITPPRRHLGVEVRFVLPRRRTSSGEIRFAEHDETQFGGYESLRHPTPCHGDQTALRRGGQSLGGDDGGDLRFRELFRCPRGSAL